MVRTGLDRLSSCWQWTMIPAVLNLRIVFAGAHEIEYCSWWPNRCDMKIPSVSQITLQRRRWWSSNCRRPSLTSPRFPYSTTVYIVAMLRNVSNHCCQERLQTDGFGGGGGGRIGAAGKVFRGDDESVIWGRRCSGMLRGGSWLSTFRDKLPPPLQGEGDWYVVPKRWCRTTNIRRVTFQKSRGLSYTTAEGRSFAKHCLW